MRRCVLQLQLLQLGTVQYRLQKLISIALDDTCRVRRGKVGVGAAISFAQVGTISQGEVDWRGTRFVASLDLSITVTSYSDDR